MLIWRTKGGKDEDYSTNSYKVGESESNNKNEREIRQLSCKVSETTMEEHVQWEDKWVIRSER